MIRTEANRITLAASDALAEAQGIFAGMNLADARALVPDLLTAPHEPEQDLAALGRLADWCSRFSPWVAVDGADGLILDLSGVAHLFGGEAAMLKRVAQALHGLALEARLGMADSAAAAWAWARYGEGVLLAPGAGLERLGALPVAALRLEPEQTDRLRILGLLSIRDLARLPRAPLARRFGAGLLSRLDALLRIHQEPISPRRKPAPWRARADLAEPIFTREAIDSYLHRLLQALCRLLEQDQRGARQLDLHAYRVDGTVQTLSIGTVRPNRDPAHLFRLFRDKLDGINPGFGIETLLLEASAADPFTAEQTGLDGGEAGNETASAPLIDRLQSRLGRNAVFRYRPLESYCPERAQARMAPLRRSGKDMPAVREPRPVILLRPPEFAEMAPDYSSFRWRQVQRPIARSAGPERLRGEWWRDGLDVAARDYYRIEDSQGRRYWLYRSHDGWFVHGLFA